MRSFIRIMVLAGVALLLIGAGGCDPGPIVWRADATLTHHLQAEASK
jgi:hypothetical protein